MSDEFDDSALPAHAGRHTPRADAHASRLPRLITRIYAASDATLRARLVQRLLDPLGTLGLAAIAAGAFAGFLQRRDGRGIRVSIEDVRAVSSEQFAELAHFVAQVSPEVLQAVASLLSDTPAGITALSVSALVLLTRAPARAAKPSAAGSAKPGPHDEVPRS